MSASNEWTEWHLTPKGWVRGSEKRDFSSVDREPPKDRVLTVVYSEFVSSSFSAMDKNLESTWQSTHAPTIAKFTAEFGPPPNTL